MSGSDRRPENPTKIDEWFERAVGDGAPKHFGTGWFSGISGVLLGVSSFFATIVFHFPGLLAIAELKERYPVPLMRALLALAIISAFLFSAMNVIVRRSKRLGLTGLAFASAAVLLGGSSVEIQPGYDPGFHIGLDWLLLNLVFLSLVFVPLERIFPLNPDQGIFRAGWTTDGLYFITNHIAAELLTFFTLLPATLIARHWQAQTFSFQIASLPLAAEVLLAMFVADMAQYWVHRGFHKFGWAWPFHAIHHSSAAMDWLAGSRLHAVDIIVTRTLVLAPVLALGFSDRALYIWLGILAVQATLNHVNMRLNLRWLEPFLVTPRFHHWHHAIAPIDKNFAVHFPWIDRMFGTCHMPAGAWPPEVGISGHPVPGSFFSQAVWPFQRQAGGGG